MKATGYQKSSSLARKFADDFPDVAEMPLQLPPRQRAAFDAHVRPLLDLAEAADPALPAAALLQALRKLIAHLEAAPAGSYQLLRGVADYVQCTFAQCALDAAAVWALDPDRRALAAALARAPAGRGAGAADEALLQELRCRLVAAGLGGMSAPLALSLREWHAGSMPSNGAAAPAPGGAGGAAVDLFPGLAATVGKTVPFWQEDGRFSWPALRRALSCAGGHYGGAVLGRDGDDAAAGTVMLTGASLGAIMLGWQPHLAAATTPCPALPDVAAPLRWLELAVVGAEGGTGAAARAVGACVREMATRHKMRHIDSPLSDASGRPVRLVLLLTRHRLCLLLPEAVAGGPGGPPPRDVAVAVRLGLARGVEELLLPRPLPRPTQDEPGEEGDPAPAPALADAWGVPAAYDGEGAWLLPSGLRALQGGRLTLDPATLRAATAEVLACRGAGGGDAGGADGDGDGGAARERAVASDLVRALALQGLQPEALLPHPGAGGPPEGGVLGALLAASCAADDGAAACAEASAEVYAPQAEAALLASSLDSMAVDPARLRAALSPAGGAGAGAAGAAGAAARTRELHAALRERHGWLWQELGPGDACELPAAMAAELGARMRAPRGPLPPEPVPEGPADAWFYGGAAV